MHETEQTMLNAQPEADEDERSTKLKRKVYERELRKLQVELCHLQEAVRQSG